MTERRGVTVLTGAGRASGIAAGIAVVLAKDGWDLLLPVWPEYDARLGIGGGTADTETLAEQIRGLGARAELLEVDLADPASPERIISAAAGLGGTIALVLSTANRSTAPSSTPTSSPGTATSPSTPEPHGS